jgi:hypothetical protein
MLMFWKAAVSRPTASWGSVAANTSQAAAAAADPEHQQAIAAYQQSSFSRPANGCVKEGICVANQMQGTSWTVLTTPTQTREQQYIAV